MSAPMVEPSACTWCGIARREHGRQYADAAGWHAWERPSDAQVLARMKARRLARVVAREGALPMPSGPEPRDVEEELTGANLSLREEEQTTARLRLALASAQRGRRDLRQLVQQMCDALNGHECPPPGELPMTAVTRVAVRLMEAERQVAELERVIAEAPASYVLMDRVRAAADRLTRTFAPTQALREDDEFGLHHTYRTGRDLPESGGA